MPGKYDIYVYEEGGVFYARPSPAIVEGGRGKHLRIRNLSKKKITLSFPPGVIVGDEVSIPARKHGQVDLDPNADDIYEYVVSVRLTSAFSSHALGNSAPKIIVDP
jgi:hypothetical protein